MEIQLEKSHRCKRQQLREIESLDLLLGLWVYQDQIESLGNEVFKIMVQRHQA